MDRQRETSALAGLRPRSAPTGKTVSINEPAIGVTVVQMQTAAGLVF